MARAQRRDLNGASGGTGVRARTAPSIPRLTSGGTSCGLSPAVLVRLGTRRSSVECPLRAAGPPATSDHCGARTRTANLDRAPAIPTPQNVPPPALRAETSPARAGERAFGPPPPTAAAPDLSRQFSPPVTTVTVVGRAQAYLLGKLAGLVCT